MRQIDKNISQLNQNVKNFENDNNESLSPTLVDPLEFYHLNNSNQQITRTEPDESWEKYRKDFDRSDKSNPSMRLATKNLSPNAELARYRNLSTSSRSRSPKKTLPSNLAGTMTFEMQQKHIKTYTETILPPIPMLIQMPNSTPQPMQTSGADLMDVQGLIRQELKKIVQIQHDTVMNFLNGGVQPSQNLFDPMYQASSFPVAVNSSNLDQQLMSVLRQQKLQTTQNGVPVEFLIETKIKTVNSQQSTGSFTPQVTSNNLAASGHETNENANYFMKNFEYSSKNQRNDDQSQSRFIKIPLLNMNIPATNFTSQTSTTKSSTSMSIQIKHENKESANKNNIKLLGFKASAQKQHNEKFHRLLHLEKENKQQNLDSSRTEDSSTRILSKYVKQCMDNTSKKSSSSPSSNNLKNFPLLKLNTSLTIESNSAADNQNQKLEKQKSQEKKKSTKPKSETAESDPNSKNVQVTKPLYDGFILSPSLFDELIKLNAANEQLSASSALAHYKSTQYIRDEESRAEKAKNKKDMFTMTETANSAHPIPPNILFKLKFDDSKPQRDIDNTISKDFVNVADLDSNDVEDILKLIEYEQTKRGGKSHSIIANVKAPKEKLANVVEKVVVDESQHEIEPSIISKPDRSMNKGELDER